MGLLGSMVASPSPASMAADPAAVTPRPSPDEGRGPVIAIQVNGEPRQCSAGLHLEQVLGDLGYRPQLVVVEYNGTILPRQCWAQQQVLESDTLEVVTIVGGGS